MRGIRQDKILDSTNPDNYRPIALTSHVCKTMEKMITERITYYLERNELFSPFQSGFRRGRSTLDPLICLETDVRKAQANKEGVLAVFFDIEKAQEVF